MSIQNLKVSIEFVAKETRFIWRNLFQSVSTYWTSLFQDFRRLRTKCWRQHFELQDGKISEAGKNLRNDEFHNLYILPKVLRGNRNQDLRDEAHRTEKVKGRDHFRDLGVNGRDVKIILKCIFNNTEKVYRGVDWFPSVTEVAVCLWLEEWYSFEFYDLYIATYVRLGYTRPPYLSYFF